MEIPHIARKFGTLVLIQHLIRGYMEKHRETFRYNEPNYSQPERLKRQYSTPHTLTMMHTAIG